MSVVAEEIETGARRKKALIKTLVWGLRVAPWVVFGPITGFMGERAYQCFRKHRPVLGGLYILANILILVSIPALTAVIASNIPATAG
jgi:hypothetical protein